MIKCGKSKVIYDNFLHKNFIEEGKVEITLLKYFIPYISNKHLALIKIDVEGQELKVLQGGLKLITEFHVPFVVLEFTPHALIEVGSKPRNLLELFVNNDYKISLKGFFSQTYITIKDLLRNKNWQNNVYFVHESVLG